MPVTCLACRKICYNIGEMADHMSDTSGGYDDIGTLKDENMNEILTNPKELEHFKDVMSRFRHRQYLDRNGIRFPPEDEMQIEGALMAGATTCSKCMVNFHNNLRLAEHVININHPDDEFHIKNSNADLQEFNNFEKKYF
jgi:hypothetical protein